MLFSSLRRWYVFRIPLLTAMFSIRFDFQYDITVIENCLE